MTKQTVQFNIVASGSLGEISEFMRDSDKLPNKFALVVPSNLFPELEAAADARSERIEINSLGIYPITDTFGYGFDVIDGDGDPVEISDNATTETGFMLIDGISGEPVAAPEVSSVVIPPSVGKLTSDELFAIVANYDSIHSAAVTELNSRIAGVKDKLAE